MFSGFASMHRKIAERSYIYPTAVDPNIQREATLVVSDSFILGISFSYLNTNSASIVPVSTAGRWQHLPLPDPTQVDWVFELLQLRPVGYIRSPTV